MPRYYCDYCDTYLTHDSPSVRKQHNSGYKHKANIRAYYQKFEEQQTQVLLEQKIKQHQAYQIGAAYNQHLSAFPGVPPRLPILPPPPMSFPGAVPHQLPPGVRPPLMQMPPNGAPGYPNAPPSASSYIQHHFPATVLIFYQLQCKTLIPSTMLTMPMMMPLLRLQTILSRIVVIDKQDLKTRDEE